jgi:hypothetical protein
VCALLLVTLTGCTPAYGATGGIRLDPARGLIGVIAWCPAAGPPATISLSIVDSEEDDREVRTPVTFRRVGPPPTGRYLEIALEEENPGWQRSGRLTETDAASQVLQLESWNAAGNHRLYTFPFRRGEVSTDTILVKLWDNQGRANPRSMTTDQFLAYAASDCR